MYGPVVLSTWFCGMSCSSTTVLRDLRANETTDALQREVSPPADPETTGTPDTFLVAKRYQMHARARRLRGCIQQSP